MKLASTLVSQTADANKANTASPGQRTVLIVRCSHLGSEPTGRLARFRYKIVVAF